MKGRISAHLDRSGGAILFLSSGCFPEFAQSDKTCF